MFISFKVARKIGISYWKVSTEIRILFFSSSNSRLKQIFSFKNFWFLILIQMKRTCLHFYKTPSLYSEEELCENINRKKNWIVHYNFKTFFVYLNKESVSKCLITFLFSIFMPSSGDAQFNWEYSNEKVLTASKSFGISTQNH